MISTLIQAKKWAVLVLVPAWLVLSAWPALAKPPQRISRSVHWRIGPRLKITRVSLPPILPLDGPPLAGFQPFVAELITDENAGEGEVNAFPESSLVGTILAGDPTQDYAIAVFDTGAVTSLSGYCESLDLGLTGEYLTANMIEIIGVGGGSTYAYVSQPIGLFADGLHAIDPATLALDTSQMVGESNTSVAVGLPEDCTDGSELPTVAGTSLSVFYTTVIRNDVRVYLERDGRLYVGPDVELFEPDDPGIPTYPRSVTLEMRGGEGGDIVAVQYIPDFFGTMEPVAPTTAVTSLVPLVNAGGSYFTQAQVTENGLSPPTAPEMMLDTGAQVSVIGLGPGGWLGLNPSNPDFTVDIEGVGGVLEDVPGFFIDELTIPAIGGLLQYTQVPMILLDIDSVEGGKLDGILGMNLFTDRNLVLHGDMDSPKLEISDPLGFDICDLDVDGDVDTVDYDTFEAAFTGAGGSAINPYADFDGDGDVDLIDFATLQLHHQPSP